MLIDLLNTKEIRCKNSGTYVAYGNDNGIDSDGTYSDGINLLRRRCDIEDDISVMNARLNNDLIVNMADYYCDFIFSLSGYATAEDYIKALGHIADRRK